MQPTPPPAGGPRVGSGFSRNGSGFTRGSGGGSGFGGGAFERRPGSAVSTNADSTSAAPSRPKSNPFGSAKPVDNTQRQREIEERLAKERAELAAKLAEDGEKDSADKPSVGKKPFPKAATGKSNPFGSAKPVDTQQALKKVEEKMAKTVIKGDEDEVAAK